MPQITFEEIIEWLCDHETAGEDFNDFFDVDIWEDDIDILQKELSTEDVISWITDHEQLSRDLLIHYTELDEHAIEIMRFSDVCDILANMTEYL